MSNDGTKQIINSLIIDYDDLRIQYHVLISKLNANSEHGKNYGLKCSLIDSDILDFEPLNEYLENIESMKCRIKELNRIVNYLAGILEKQRMHFLVNYFCSSDTSEAFPKYIIPLLKSKYHKLYVNLICCSSSEEGEGGYYFEEDFIYDNSEYIEEESVLKSYVCGPAESPPINCPAFDVHSELIEPGVHFEFDS
tara:strand:- start:1646 stop:2230 length:585 start_codon:yes stop_codon:yes gene_type:complete